RGMRGILHDEERPEPGPQAWTGGASRSWTALAVGNQHQACGGAGHLGMRGGVVSRCAEMTKALRTLPQARYWSWSPTSWFGWLLQAICATADTGFSRVSRPQTSWPYSVPGRRSTWSFPRFGCAAEWTALVSRAGFASITRALMSS